LFLNRSEPAKKSGQNIPKNRCRTTMAERMMDTLAELPLIGDQVVCLSHEPGRPQRNAIPRGGCGLRKAEPVEEHKESGIILDLTRCRQRPNNRAAILQSKIT
jgi:hypothetical protein